MKVLNDFRCKSCGKTTEEYIDSGIQEIDCSCGGLARKILGMPQVRLDGTDPSLPGAYEKWANKRELWNKQHRKKSYVEPR